MDWKKVAPWNWFKEEEPETEASALSDSLATLLRPRLDISEGKKAYTIRADLPGVKRDDISLEVDGRTLSVRAEKRQESEEGDETYHCVERSFGAVQRVLSLPEDADASNIDAKFKNGVLKLKIPRLTPRAPKGRDIQVH